MQVWSLATDLPRMSRSSSFDSFATNASRMFSQEPGLDVNPKSNRWGTMARYACVSREVWAEGDWEFALLGIESVKVLEELDARLAAIPTAHHAGDLPRRQVIGRQEAHRFWRPVFAIPLPRVIGSGARSLGNP